jgi:L-ascorbate metabolism protein UlaG (beta-lactamase superfamily)
VQHGGFGKTLRIFWNMLFNKPRNTRPVGDSGATADPRAVVGRPRSQRLPPGAFHRTAENARQVLADRPGVRRARLAVQLGRPKRFHAPPISLEELPPLEAVILSHNHYDHLDRKAVVQLADKTRHFLAPLGVGDILIKWGVDASKVQQLDWWQGVEVDGMRFVATPAQHFSGRGLFDANQTLWCSWVMIDGARRIFFSGDTGYFDGFKRIGEQFGPFDLT